MTGKRVIFVMCFCILEILFQYNSLVYSQIADESPHTEKSSPLHEEVNNVGNIFNETISESRSSENNNNSEYTENSSTKNTSSDSSDSQNDWEKHQRRIEQQEARRKQKQRDKEKTNIYMAKRTLQAASTETCDWRTQPLAIVRGEVCGSYYKVLGLDRKRGVVDKADIKKAYRQKSLHVHPDKNSSPEANEAFKVVQEAYECLSDEACRKNYDRRLSEAEEEISTVREQIRKTIIAKSFQMISNLHYYVSVAAHHVYQTGLELWDLAGEFEMQIFGEPRPVGQAIFSLLLFWKFRMLLKIYVAATGIVKLNYELLKWRGLV